MIIVEFEGRIKTIRGRVTICSKCIKITAFAVILLLMIAADSNNMSEN